MHDITAKKGPYLHAVDDMATLRFVTGGTPRVFTVVVASAREDYTINRARNGVAIIDEDLRQVVLDEHARGDKKEATACFERMKGMSWAEFSVFCRTHERYRGKSPDITSACPTPDPGSRRNQEAMGGSVASADGCHDLRSDHLAQADRDPNCPYRFPRTTHEDAIRDISEMPLSMCENGTYRLAWPIDTVSDVARDGGAGPASVDPARNMAWEALLHQHPEIMEEAALSALGPFLNDSVSTWDASDEGRYSFAFEGDDGDVVTLASIDGRPMDFESRGALGVFLESLDTADLRDLWKLKRTVDHELAPDVLASRVSFDLNAIRSEMDAQPSIAEDALEP